MLHVIMAIRIVYQSIESIVNGVWRTWSKALDLAYAIRELGAARFQLSACMFSVGRDSCSSALTYAVNRIGHNRAML